MIALKKLNGEAIFVNPDVIRYVECTPDTVITFMDGKKIIVKDSPQCVIDMVVGFRQRCRNVSEMDTQN